jgi:prophage maintenance system killer protein
MHLLLSAVDRQFVSFGGKDKWKDPFEKCGTLFYGLVTNHPFHDANKRTAFLSVLYLLHKMHRCPSVSEKEFEDFTVEIADKKLDKYARYRDMVKKGEEDPEVKFIGKYLRDKTRQIDNTNYAITYRQLRTILNRYGFDFDNPYRKYIDVVKHGTRKRLFGLLGSEPTFTRVCQIGFPRWSAEVSRAALKTVREATQLSARDGVDSAAFFKGLDPMQSLITSYNEPLMRLANR